VFMKKGLFIKKSIDALSAEAVDGSTHALKRHLGPWHLTAMGIGAIIGAGIFVLTGQAAAQYAGPGIIFSMIIAAIICVFAAFCYAEFASMIPVSGSAYSYAYATLGELPAWIMGCCLTLEFLFSAATVAVGWGGYFISFMRDLGWNISPLFSQTPLLYDIQKGWEWTGSLVNLPAVVVIGLIGLLVSIGIKTAASLNNAMVVIKMAVIALFIGCGIFFINTDNWHPFIPENTGIFGNFGWSGIFRGAGLVFFAFIGFDALSTLAQETRNPQRDLPIGMMGSLGISTVVYILIALVMTGIASYQTLNVADPFAVAVDALGPRFLWLRFVMKLAILSGLTSVILVMLLGQSRIFYIMARDGLLPRKMGTIHSRFKTPFFNTLLISVIAMLAAGFLPVTILGNITTIGTLLAFTIVCFGVLYLRYKEPHRKRPFKTPFSPWIPAAGTLTCLAQMLFLPGVVWLQLTAWMVIGIAFYFFYGKKHSKLR
jgi:basic amino acid/polyamine antiporter, APA family